MKTHSANDILGGKFNVFFATAAAAAAAAAAAVVTMKYITFPTKDIIY